MHFTIKGQHREDFVVMGQGQFCILIGLVGTQIYVL